MNNMNNNDGSNLNIRDISNNYTPGNHNRNRDDSVNYGDISLNDSNDLGNV